MPWHSQPKIDLEWKKKLATDILSNLSEARFVKQFSHTLLIRTSLFVGYYKAFMFCFFHISI